MKKVLIPVDGSPQSLAAVRAAIAEGPAIVESIDLLNVQPRLNRHISRWVPRANRDAWRAERTENALARARALVQSCPIAWRTHASCGPVAAAIAAAARQLGADEIVMGATRRGLFERAFANSVSTRLLETSSVPVRIIPAAEVPLFERLALPAGLGLIALFLLAD